MLMGKVKERAKETLQIPLLNFIQHRQNKGMCDYLPHLSSNIQMDHNFIIIKFYLILRYISYTLFFIVIKRFGG